MMWICRGKTAGQQIRVLPDVAHYLSWENKKKKGCTHDLEAVSHDADGHELIAVVAAVHHERVGQTLDDGALSLAETLGGIATSRVREVDGVPDLNVVAV